MKFRRGCLAQGGTGVVARTMAAVLTALSVPRSASAFTVPSRGPFGARSAMSISASNAAGTGSAVDAPNTVDGGPASSSGTNVRLSPRVLETLDPCVVLMKDLMGRYAHLWEDRGGIFSLAQGVVYWQPPQTCQARLRQDLSDPSSLLHTYGPAHGTPELVQVLENKIAEENGMTNHHVMVTVGANQAYTNIVLTCLPQQSKAVVFAPYYFNHVMAIQMTNGNDSVLVGPCTEDGVPDINWLRDQLRRQSSSEAAADIAMVTIVNPGNPTGVSLSKNTLQEAVDLCREHGAWLVLDCTYEYFTPRHQQPIATFPHDPHVIHVFSFSKSYSLAGYRCGYVCLNKDNEALWSNMMKIQDTIPIGPPRISQVAALGAMEAGKKWVYEQYETLDGSREAILQALSPLRTIGGTGAMYVMAQLPTTEDADTPDDVEVCRRLVEEHGIAIIPGSFCGFPGWVRVCYANLEPGLCLEAAERLKNGIQGIVISSED